MRIRLSILSTLVGLVLLSCNRNLSVNDINPLPREVTEMEASIIQSSNSFGFKLFREIVTANQDSNLFISPLSISMALSMALNGADGTTADAIRRTLGYDGLTTEEINKNFKSLISLLTGLDPAVRFNIANSAWNRSDFTLEPDFIKALKEYYNADITGMDFSDPGSVDIINSWVSEKTEGKIDEIISEIDPLTVLFLINALYFKADWTVQFDPQNTLDGTFTAANGSTVQTPMMNLTTSFGYFETSTFQAIDLKYGKERYSMSIFLPKTGKTLTDLYTEFTPENWPVWLSLFSDQDVSLQIPKFKMEFEIELRDILTSPGMGIAFSEQADFSKINSLWDIFISRVKHKTFVELDEEGTEAAAVTVVDFRYSISGAAVYLNRPFLFLIRDHHADTIMFIGVMANPAE